MFGVALSLAEFALVASMLGYVRRVEPGALPSSTARREPAYCRYSGRNRAHRGREYGNRSALLGYPVWAIPLIAVFGAGGAIVAIRVFG